MGRPKKEETVAPTVDQLNTGVDYMAKKEETPAVAANNQPVVNTAAAKEKVGAVAGKAKNAATDFVSKAKTDKKTMIIAIVVVVLVLLFLGSGVKMLSGPYRVTNSYMSAYKKKNPEKVVKLMHEDTYEKEKDEVESWENDFDRQEDNDYILKSYKIRECHSYSKDELEDFAELMEERYDIDEEDIKGYKTCWVRVKSETDGDKGLRYMSVSTFKVKGKWYLYN